jgi:hypothetical protein
VIGIGADDSKVALYEDADGDRGIIAVEVSTQQTVAQQQQQQQQQKKACLVTTAWQCMVLCRSV